MKNIILIVLGFALGYLLGIALLCDTKHSYQYYKYGMYIDTASIIYKYEIEPKKSVQITLVDTIDSIYIAHTPL